jgi:hypothetical protein
MVRPPMHFATGDEIDASDLLLEDCGVRCAKPCIREITRCESSVDRAPRTHRGALCARDSTILVASILPPVNALTGLQRRRFGGGEIMGALSLVVYCRAGREKSLRSPRPPSPSS